VIISPDHYLIDQETGEYVWSPDRVKAAWNSAKSKLAMVLRSPRVKKLVLMVGVPASGKSTWLRANKEPGAVYFDATFTNQRARSPIVQMAKAAGKEVDAVVMVTPINVCLDRNACRTPDRMVPHEVVQRMTAQLAGDPPRKSEGFDRIRMVRTVS
jgi:predicted kinase